MCNIGDNLSYVNKITVCIYTKAFKQQQYRLVLELDYIIK